MLTTLYALDQSSVRQAPQVLWGMVSFTALAAALFYGFYGRRAWWLILGAAFIVPTAFVLMFGGELRGSSVFDFVSGVILPLAMVGLPSALIGVLLAAGGRRIRWR